MHGNGALIIRLYTFLKKFQCLRVHICSGVQDIKVADVCLILSLNLFGRVALPNKWFENTHSFIKPKTESLCTSN